LEGKCKNKCFNFQQKPLISDRMNEFRKNSRNTTEYGFNVMSSRLFNVKKTMLVIVQLKNAANFLIKL
jgi:hypothetical protein